MSVKYLIVKNEDPVGKIEITVPFDFNGVVKCPCCPVTLLSYSTRTVMHSCHYIKAVWDYKNRVLTTQYHTPELKIAHEVACRMNVDDKG